MTQQLLSPQKVAEMLSISRSNVYRHMEYGNIESIKIGRLRRIKLTAVNKFISLMEQKMRVAQS